MKCTYLSEQEANPATLTEFAKTQVTWVPKLKNGRRVPVCVFPAGSQNDHPMCWRLVQMGVAVPADDECAKKANMTAEEMEKAQYAQKRLASGTPVDEFPLYDAGVILGYKNGEPIPGPKWEEYQAAKAAADAPLEDDDE